VLQAPSILFSFIRSPGDNVGGQQVLRSSTAGLRSISHPPGLLSWTHSVIIRSGRRLSVLWQGIMTRFPVGERRCLFSKASAPALGNAQPPTQYFPRLGSRGMKLTSRFHLVPRLSTAIPPLPNIPSWRALG